MNKIDLNKYSKKELIQILECYNTYIIAFEEDRWDSDAYPTCLEEFLANEYQYMLNDGYTSYSEWLDYLRETDD